MSSAFTVCEVNKRQTQLRQSSFTLKNALSRIFSQSSFKSSTVIPITDPAWTNFPLKFGRFSAVCSNPTNDECLSEYSLLLWLRRIYYLVPPPHQKGLHRSIYSRRADGNSKSLIRYNLFTPHRCFNTMKLSRTRSSV